MMLISDAAQRLCIPSLSAAPRACAFEPVHSVANHIGWRIQRNIFLAKTGLLEMKLSFIPIGVFLFSLTVFGSKISSVFVSLQ